MKTTGMFRRIDKTGRIVIPGEIRRSLGIKGGDPVEIFARNKEIVLRKYNAPGVENMMLKGAYEEIMTEAGLWEESGTECEDVRELGVSEGLLLAAEIVKKAMKDN